MSRRTPSLLWVSGMGVAALASLGLVWGAMRSRDSQADPPPGLSPQVQPAKLSTNAAPGPTLTLDETQRELLWQIEHHGLALGRFGFQPLADALKKPDRRALEALLAPDFTGRFPSHPRAVRFDSDFAHVVRLQDAGEAPESLDRSGFLDRLLAWRKPFAKPPKVKLALMGLTPTVPTDLNKPWKGTCQLRIWGEAAEGQPREVMAYLAYEVSRPDEDTLRQKKWLRACTITQVQEAHAPRFLMREVAAKHGIDSGDFHDNWKPGEKWVNTGGAFLADYDRDGQLDLLITDINTSRLYKGLPGGSFRNVTTELGLPLATPTVGNGAGINAAFADLDGDGWDDLILGENVYRNLEGRGFDNITSRTNLRLPEGVGGVAVADYDRDGRLDLYLTRVGTAKESSWIDGKNGQAAGNILLHNLGNWKFADVTAQSGTAADDRSTFSAVWFDADEDGWPDLYVINEFGNGVLLANQHGGRFAPHNLVDGPGDFGSMGLTCGDINNDGHVDLYVANMYSKAGNRVIGNLRPDTYPADIMAKMRSFTTGSQLHLNQGGLKFEPVGQALQVADVGWAYGPAMVDLDNDGWLDIYATCGFFSQSRSEPDG